MVDQEVELIEHLSELRKRIITTLCAFLFILIFSFVFVQDIYQWLSREWEGKLTILGPSDILWIYFMIAGVIALTFTIPISAYQIWKFVQPALTVQERKVTLAYIPALFILFLLGISFGYFLVFPVVLTFLTALSAEHFETMFTAEKYFSFMFNLTVPFGLLFEIPLITMFLTTLGVIDPYKLVKYRKIAYFLLIVLSVLITPPDFISDILVIIPLLLLFELSVTLSRIVYKRKSKST
ncbi:twin-arginine translocase subunit TatC [Caldalkalibacillus mannanilyticus]|uniref:twin-arginine translocase subunit TatC n=1 Tax=Caldalkalibacillus mannanilyticus TaxID=1418 RepID=UPI0004687050|nr:twin-arginine translocase subunit TatC [Caldalkalibacillus mannanilyticus]